MPQRRTSIKDLRKTKTRRLMNLDIKTDLRKTTKKFLLSVESKNAQEAASNLRVLSKKLDKAAKRNVIHKNTASRRKSRFGKLVMGLKDKR